MANPESELASREQEARFKNEWSKKRKFVDTKSVRGDILRLTPDDPKGTLLFCPGWMTTNPESNKGPLQEFFNHGYTVVTFVPTLWKGELHPEDYVPAEVEAISEGLSSDTAIVAGHSRGGVTGIAFMKQNPERTTGQLAAHATRMEYEKDRNLLLKRFGLRMV